MIKIGITGGIGAGKSFIADILKKKGYHVYDCDEHAKLLMNASPKIKKELINLFGDKAYINETLNAPFIASCIFKDKILLQKLNEIVHPEVMNDFKEWSEEKKSNNDIVFCESAILFESGFNVLVDRIWCVAAPIELRRSRAMERDSAAREKIESRIASQLPQEEKIEKSHVVIINDNKQDLESQINETLLSHSFSSK